MIEACNAHSVYVRRPHSTEVKNTLVFQKLARVGLSLHQSQSHSRRMTTQLAFCVGEIVSGKCEGL